MTCTNGDIERVEEILTYALSHHSVERKFTVIRQWILLMYHGFIRHVFNVTMTLYSVISSPMLL